MDEVIPRLKEIEEWQRRHDYTWGAWEKRHGQRHELERGLLEGRHHVRARISLRDWALFLAALVVSQGIAVAVLVFFRPG